MKMQIEEYIKFIQKIGDKLIDVGYPLDESIMIFALLCSFRP